MNAAFGKLPPDNCVPCSRSERYNSNKECTLVREDSRGTSGISYQGLKYHINEFFLYKNEEEDGPASIGQVKNIQLERRGGTIIVLRKVGRVPLDLKGVQIGDETPNTYVCQQVGIRILLTPFYFSLSATSFSLKRRRPSPCRS